MGKEKKQVFAKWIPALPAEGKSQVVFDEIIDGSLQTLQKKVGGLIELVRLSPGIDMYINEEGKLSGLPINVIATQLYQHYRKVKNDYIVGDVILAGSRNGGVVSLSDSRRKELTRVIRGFGELELVLG